MVGPRTQDQGQMAAFAQRRRQRPSLEVLEARDLPSTFQVVGPTRGEHGAKGPYLNLIVVKDPSRGDSRQGTSQVSQPAQDEVRGETFVAEFTGRYSVGAPRASGQSSTIHIDSKGNAVTSNWFHKGRARILLFPPAEPPATSTTPGPASGFVTGL